MAQPGFNVNVGAALTILSNDAVEAIVGTFAGQSEGSIVPLTGGTGGFFITYKGGDGNDVVLSRTLLVPVDPKILTVTFSKGTGPAGFDQVSVTGTATPTTTLKLQASTNLNSWSDLQTVTANGAGAVIVTINQTPGIPRRFLRLKP